MKGTRIHSLEIKSLNLRFLKSNNYLEGNEFDIADQQMVANEKIFFPTNIHYEYWAMIDRLEESMLLNFSDSNELIEKKKTYYESVNVQEWSFEVKLIEFVDYKLMIFALSLCRFIRSCFDLQKILSKTINETNVIHPFQENIYSYPSFIYAVCNLFYLRHEELYAVMNEYGCPMRKSSKLEYEWASFLEFEYPEKQYRHNFNHPLGQIYFKECIPDLYSEITKEAIFINGCYIHGHLNCLENSNANPTSLNFLKKTYEELNNEFDLKIKKLKENNLSSIKTVKVLWECEFKFIIKETEAYKRFKAHVFKEHPLLRLRPRDAVRGGFINSYALKWNKALHPNERFFCLDINGLYSYCAINFSYVIGKYEIIIGETLKHIQILSNKLYYKNQKMYGVIFLTILPPNNLKFPFLPTKLSNGKTVLTLCLKCSELQMKKSCKHSESERSFTSTYTINEIEFALNLGYKIVNIFECHFYKRQKKVLNTFVKHLNVLKIQNSNCLVNKTPDEQELYCTFLNDAMSLDFPLSLSPDNIKYNPQNHKLYKLAANALFGKIQQRSNHPKSIYASSQTELEELFFEHNTNIDNIVCHNDLICELLVKPDELKLSPNRNANCYIGAQITSFARQVIYEHIQTLEKQNAQIFYVDTDAIYFSLPLSSTNPLMISDAVGHFKNVIQGEILSFYCLGSKNYILSYCDNSNFIKFYSKVKGLSLKSNILQSEIQAELYASYIESFVASQKRVKSFNQIHTKKSSSNKSKFHLNSLELRTLCNNINTERILVNNDIYSSLPYGYIETFE